MAMAKFAQVTKKSQTHMRQTLAATPVATPDFACTRQHGRNRWWQWDTWLSVWLQCGWSETHQYSIAPIFLGTLMRHYFSFGSLARTPELAACGVLKAPSKARLVALAGRHLQLPTPQLGAPICAINLAMVAIAADKNLRATAGTNKEASRDFKHECLWQTKGVLDGSRPRMQQ
jgi:hypothetical protein